MLKPHKNNANLTKAKEELMDYYGIDDLRDKSLQELTDIYNSITELNVKTFKCSTMEAIERILNAQADSFEESGDAKSDRITEQEIAEFESVAESETEEVTDEVTEQEIAEQEIAEPKAENNTEASDEDDLEDIVAEDDLEDDLEDIVAKDDLEEPDPIDDDYEFVITPELVAQLEELAEPDPIDEEWDTSEIFVSAAKLQTSRRTITDRERDVAKRISSTLVALSRGNADYFSTSDIAEKAGTKRGTTANYLSNWLHGRMQNAVQMLPGRIYQAKLMGRFVGWRID